MGNGEEVEQISPWNSVCTQTNRRMLKIDNCCFDTLIFLFSVLCHQLERWWSMVNVMNKEWKNTKKLFSQTVQWAELTVHQFSSVQLLSHVRFFATPWIAARQASLSITNSRSSLRLMSIESVMPSSHLILGRPLLLLPLIPPSISLFQWVNSLHEVSKVLEFQL